MRHRLRTALQGCAAAVAVVSLALACAPVAGAATSTPSPSTSISLTAAQVAQALFVAGDVGRLGQNPSGAEGVVLEKVLQQLYLENPTLDPGQATSDIQALEGDLASGPNALSAPTLTLMAGNQQILAILNALEQSSPPAPVAHALAQVGDLAVGDASHADQFEGNAFDASADSLATLDFSSFSPATVLAASWSLAAIDKSFGTARDDLWATASHESILDDTQQLLSANPALQTSAINAFTSQLGADGSLTTTVGGLEQLVETGVTQIGDQSCTLAPGTTGASPGNCNAGALHDAQMVAQACPNGPTSSGGCASARSQAQSDEAAELSTIAAQEAVSTAAGEALGAASSALAASETAEAQAAAEVASEENQYLAWQTTQTALKTVFDVATLGVSLSVSEIDPVTAVTGLFNVIGDAIGLGFGGPDPNTIILQGIQNLSQQLSDFETYTQSAFSAVNESLAGISSQIAQESYQLSAQLTQAQTQITALGTKLTELQGSVDHLESEVQSLFAQGANNDLNTIINQDLGYQQANGTALPQATFAQAAGALYQDATNTSLTSTVLTPPAGFDALTADTLVTPSDPLSLDSNINYFNLFGGEVTDAASGEPFPGPLTTSCAPGANVSAGLCLPNPDYWATAARAFSQLLEENPEYVTPTRITQLNTIEQDGEAITNALSQLSVNNAGTDQYGSGNKTLDAALQYYQNWAYGATGDPTKPSLYQAISGEEQRYLQSLPVPNLSPLTYGVFNPWGGDSQTPDAAGLASTSMITTMQVPVCQSEVNDGITGLINPNSYLYAQKLTAGDFSFLAPVVLNALRLGIGTLSACYTASFGVPQTSSGGPFTISVEYTYNGPSGSGVSNVVGSVTANSGFESLCGFPDEGNQEIQALDAVAAGCNDLDTLLASSPYQVATLPDDVSNYVHSQVDQALASLQADVYNDIISNLKSGASSPATDVQTAAQRLDGANAVLDGYISLGLPQALASDDTLDSLVAGQNEDAFALTDPGYNPWGASFSASVPGALIDLYQAALAAMPAADPLNQVVADVYERATDLATALSAHIVPASGSGASGAAAERLVSASLRLDQASTTTGASAPNSGILAEVNPLISPTLDTIAQTQAGLSDLLNNGARLSVTESGNGSVSSSGATPISGSGVTCPGNCSASFSPGATVTLTESPSGGATFTGWSGACAGSGSTCTVQLDDDQFVTATFTGGNPTTTAPPSSSTTPTTATTATTPMTPTTTGSAKTGSATTRSTTAGCTVTAAGQLNSAGKLTVTVRCKRQAKIALNGALVIQSASKSKHAKPTTIRLKTVRASIAANRTTKLIVGVPATATTALARKQRETVSFTLTTGSQTVNSKPVKVVAPKTAQKPKRG